MMIHVMKDHSGCSGGMGAHWQRRKTRRRRKDWLLIALDNQQ